MKKGRAGKSKETGADELRDEYRFDYSTAKPNRFASRVDRSRLVVALDPDVSEVFTTPDAVNKALRALIEAMPTTTRGSR
jgi:hypothetical protein